MCAKVFVLLIRLIAPIYLWSKVSVISRAMIYNDNNFAAAAYVYKLGAGKADDPSRIKYGSCNSSKFRCKKFVCCNVFLRVCATNWGQSIAATLCDSVTFDSCISIYSIDRVQNGLIDCQYITKQEKKKTHIISVGCGDMCHILQYI